VQENNQLRTGIGAMKTDFDALQNQNETMRIESGKWKGNLKALAIKFKQLQEEHKKTSEKNAVLEQENRGQATYIEELKVSLDKMATENKKLERLYEEQIRNDKDLWEQNKELKMHLNKTRAITDELNDEVHGLRSQLEVLEPENDRLKRMLEEARQGLEQLEGENGRLRHEWDMTKRDFDGNWQGISRENMLLRNEMTRLKSENEELTVFYSIKL